MAAASQTPVAAVPAKPAESGVHLIEWGCELVGTALLLIGGLSAVVFDFGPGSPLYSLSQSPKLLITGLLFAGTGSLVTISGLGRRSGAHLNPAVTLAFWTQRKVHPHDVVGYALAQVVGAVVGTLVLWGLWRHRASALHLGVTLPGRGLNGWEAMLVEVGMTAVLILTILFMTSYRRTARWTPLVLWFVIAVLVWQGAPYTGTSLNPARSFGPALVGLLFRSFWVYVAGPLLGALLAVLVFALFRDVQVLTAKLFHDPAYPSTMASSLPVAPRR